MRLGERVVVGRQFPLRSAAFKKVDGPGKMAKTLLDRAFLKCASLFTPTVQLHGLSSTCPTTVYSNSHKCTHTIQGIINHRHLGKVSDDYGWCLWFSMTESSCLELHNAPRGAVNLAD